MIVADYYYLLLQARDSGRLHDLTRQDLLGPAAHRVHLVRHRAGQAWAEAEAEAKA